MRHTHTDNKTNKEEIFKQLDSLLNDTTRAEFIEHLYQMGKLSSKEALKIAKEYNQQKHH
ncbi:MAG: hypothetical protein KH259_01620 [Haemophilus paraphrohaemolyticus]|jgi:hypothetical protein|uniref:hypothetical protein n=1 Tax=Haemophilus TaxID=724 RepID=UPI001CF7ED78|nr:MULTISPECIES: hypothetical protein [Haemophilus]MBS6672808.1 hypothetical protein [Haemophilus paraphrohaemolyticus]